MHRATPKPLCAAYPLYVVAIVGFAAATAAAQGVDYRLGVGHNTGDSIGLDDGFTRFESWLPLARPSGDSILFADLRMLLFNDQTEADGANIGLGGRWHDTLANRIWGAHVYYDYRDTGHSHFNQISWGVENLGPTWDWRVNAHLPIGDTWYDFLTPDTTTDFIGQNLFFTGIAQEVALRGVQAEVAEVLADGESWQLRGAAGMYGYWHDAAGISAVGPRGRMELRVGDQLWLSGYLQHDDEFQTTGGLTFVWRYGLRQHVNGCNSSQDLACRLGDPVERIQQIAIKRHTTGIGSVQVVRNDQGEAYTFHHVDSFAPDGGNGTIETPTNNLAAASHQPENIVLVHGGSQFTGQLFTTTTEGQRVLAEGVEHTIATQQLGQILLPVINSGPAPVIRDAPGNAITIAANGVEVSGFEIVTPEVIYESIIAFEPNRKSMIMPYFSTNVIRLHAPEPAGGIVASGVNDINVHRNSVTGASGSGLRFENLGGVNRIAGNITENNLGSGIEISGGFSGDLAGNVANDNRRYGIHVEGNIDGNVVKNISDNRLPRQQRSLGGILVEGNVSGDVQGNSGSGHGFYQRISLDDLDSVVPTDGIRINGDVGGDVFSNTADGNLGDGIFIHESIGGSVARNVTSSNYWNGVFVGEDVHGDIIANTAMNNDGRGFITESFPDGGIYVQGRVPGGISSSEVGNKWGSSIFIGGQVFGNITGNQTNRTLPVGFDRSSSGSFVGDGFTDDVNESGQFGANGFDR